MFAKHPTQRGNWLLSVPLFNPWHIASFISFEIYQICKLKLLFHPQIEMKFTPNEKGKKLPEPNHLNCLLVFTITLTFLLIFFRGRNFRVFTHIRNTMSNYLGRNGNANNVDNATNDSMDAIYSHFDNFEWIPLNVHPPPTCMWSPLCDYCHQTSVAVDAVTLLLFLLLPHRRIIKCECTLFTLQMLASIQRIDMDHILRMFRLLAT